MSLEQIELGNLIRKKRKSLGLTLTDLAGENISVPTISNIERGVVNNVSEDKIAYLLEKLGLDERTIEQMKQSDTEEREAVEFELSIINNLVETGVLDIAREQILALEKLETLNSHEDLLAELQLAKAHLYRRQKQWDRASRLFRKVIQIAGEAQFDSTLNIEPEAYCYLGQCVYQDREDCEQALRYSESALQAFDEDGEKAYLKGRIYYDKAVYHYHLEAYAPAYECIHEAKEASTKASDIRLLVLAYNLEGTILKKQKMYAKAIPLFKKAIDISTSLYSNQALSSSLYLNLGDNYYHAGKYDEAKYCYDIGAELCQKTKDHRILSLIYCSYGELYFNTEEYDKAAEFADKAAEIAKKHTTALEYLQVLVLKARIESYQDDETVLVTCQEGIKLAEKVKQYEKKKTFHFILAKFYNKINDEERFMHETRNMFHVESLIQGR